jgi:nucleotide-binding universal stress UspA family protein
MVEKSGDKNRTQTRLDQAILDLQEVGINCEGYFIQGEVEKAISDHINNHDINFLIMGAYGHSRIRSLVIGSTTAQMLRSTRIPVLLFR